eukprot:scaffold19179_cov35-Tisochrysis_lutea.AAC.5
MKYGPTTACCERAQCSAVTAIPQPYAITVVAPSCRAPSTRYSSLCVGSTTRPSYEPVCKARLGRRDQARAAAGLYLHRYTWPVSASMAAHPHSSCTGSRAGQIGIGAWTAAGYVSTATAYKDVTRRSKTVAHARAFMCSLLARHQNLRKRTRLLQFVASPLATHPFNGDDRNVSQPFPLLIHWHKAANHVQYLLSSLTAVTQRHKR